MKLYLDSNLNMGMVKKELVYESNSFPNSDTNKTSPVLPKKPTKVGKKHCLSRSECLIKVYILYDFNYKYIYIFFLEKTRKI